MEEEKILIAFWTNNISIVDETRIRNSVETFTRAKKKNLAINLKRNKLPSSINIFERSKEPTNHHPQFLLVTP